MSTERPLGIGYRATTALSPKTSWQNTARSAKEPSQPSAGASGASKAGTSAFAVFLYELATRLLGIIVSAVILIALSPLMLLIALLLKLNSPGPVLFRHVRIGLNRRRKNAEYAGGADERKKEMFGRPFVLYKFRSMYVDARERFPHLYSYSYSEEEMRTLPIKILVSTKGNPREFDSKLHIDEQQSDDPRVTSLGCWLRKTSIDELPNFFNVFKGDMNLVGPRPDIVENIRFYPEDHMRKLDVRPGITGLAQISGRGSLSFQQTNEYDVEYVDQRSFILDLKILMKTVVVSIKRDGAF